jgi:starch synthase
MRVAFLSSEVAPFCKTGGLGDVVGALPAALVEADPDLETATFLPFHRAVKKHLGERAVPVRDTGLTVTCPIGGHQVTARLLEHDVPGRARTLFVDAPGFFDREGLYGHGDDALRYGFFSRAVVTAAARVMGGPPDLIHAHDWQTGLAPAYLEARRPASLPRTRSIFTIHNLAYQGMFGKDVLPLLDLDWNLFRFDILESHDAVSFMKGAIAACDCVSTVSPTYAREILGSEFGCGLDAHLRAHARKLIGILNGLDVHEWDPARNPHLPAPFSADDPSGKAACRDALLEEVGLPGGDDAPVLGVVSRFTGQKGLDLVCDVVPNLVKRNARLVVLGTGEPALQQRFQWLAAVYPDHVAVKVDFDVGLSHRIAAGSDLYLIPSRFEPCGLTQLQAMRYGAIPVVHSTGGLRDTVHDPGDAELLAGRGTGFRFDHPTAAGLLWATDRAIRAWRRDREGWARLMQTALRTDVSWADPAARYLALYRKVLA